MNANWEQIGNHSQTQMNGYDENGVLEYGSAGNEGDREWRAPVLRSGRNGVRKNNFIFLKHFREKLPLKPQARPVMWSHLDDEVRGRNTDLSWKLVREVGNKLLLNHLGSSFFRLTHRRQPLEQPDPDA
jgi:hypothetical protein